MVSNVPTSVPVYTDLIDDQDWVKSLHPNRLQDDVTALANLVGMMGKAQSWGVDYNTAAKFGKAPICTKKDADEIYVSAGVVWIANAAGSVKLPRRNTAVITLTASDLDTGSFADDTLYYIHAVADTAANTFTCKISLSATSPTGLTNFEVIGWFWNQSASALDITIAYVGNMKSNGRDVPNIVTKASTVQVTTTAVDPTFSDDTEALIKFYSSGRPCLMIYNLQWGVSTATQAAAQFSVDAADVTATDRWVTPGATSTNKYGVVSSLVQSLAAGIHTIQGRIAVGGGTGYVNAREITVLEL